MLMKDIDQKLKLWKKNRKKFNFPLILKKYQKILDSNK